MYSQQEIIAESKRILKHHYGERFAGLFLYGSVARHQDDSSSDIDLLVLFAKPFDFYKELRVIVDLLYPVQLKSDQLISAKPAVKNEFDSGTLHFYRTIQQEGVAA